MQSFRAANGLVRRPYGTCVTNANSFNTGGRIVPSANSSKVPQITPKDKPANVSNLVFNDKYCIESNFIFPEWGSDDLLDYSIFLEQVSFFENLENSVFKGGKGNFVKHIDDIDDISNLHGNLSVKFCKDLQMRILNGRFLGDSLGFFTF